MESVIFGGASAIGWGLSYVTARTSVRQMGAIRSLLYTEFVSVIMLTLYLILVPSLPTTPVSGDLALAVAMAVAAALLSALAEVLYAKSTEYGKLSIVAPLSSTYAVVVVVLSVLNGTVLTLLQWVAVAITLFGVALTAVKRGSVDTTPASKATLIGTALACGSALLWGASFWLTGVAVVTVLGSALPAWIGSFVMFGVLGLWIGLAMKRQGRISLQLPARGEWGAVLATTVTANVAQIANNVGLMTANIALVSVIGSLASAVTVVIARLMLREHLTRIQWAGIFLILFGVAVLSAAPG
ncbi:MAG: EamA family transporter [Chloroflexi bacterium]|nr:EamA family transporter [Chloroflexota bacterium]